MQLTAPPPPPAAAPPEPPAHFPPAPPGPPPVPNSGYPNSGNTDQPGRRPGWRFAGGLVTGVVASALIVGAAVLINEGDDDPVGNGAGGVDRQRRPG